MNAPNYVELKNISIIGETEKAYRFQCRGGRFWMPKRTVKMDNGIMYCQEWIAEEKGIPKLKCGRYGFPDLLDELSSSTVVAVSTDGNMSHQTAAIEHLHDRRVFALFMECRAGKTKVAIDLVTNHFRAGHIDRCLWIMPLSVERTAKWQWDYFRQSDFPVMFFGSETLSGCARKRLQPILDFIAEGKCALIVDESHMFKNGRSVRFERISEFAPKCPVRGILTGSPITQNINDLYAQMRILDWRIFGYKNYYQFQRYHLIMSDKYPGLIRDTVDVDILTERMEPYVFDYFSPTSNDDREDIIYCSLSEEQRDVYEDIKDIIIGRIEYKEESGIEIYLMLTALQSVMAGYLSPRVQKRIWNSEEEAEPMIFASPKFDEFKKHRANIDEKVIVWCSRKHEIYGIAESMPDVITVSGDDAADERHEKISRFRESAGGTLAAMLPVAKRGIDIYECDTAMFYGQSFDYESRIQAAARIKAPAVKNRPCVYYDFVYRDSLDEKILQSHYKKENIISYFTKLLKVDKQRALKELKSV